MQAVVFRDIGKIGLEEVPDPKVEAPTDAIVRLTTSAICGTDLHFVRGTIPGVKAGTVLGHEGVGIIEALGSAVRNLNLGDRVVIPSTIACGVCAYCRVGYYSQCDNANPGGRRAGTAFFGGPADAGGFAGLQAEKARIPFANVGLVKLPDDVEDDQAILLSDIFPTAWFGAKMAEIQPGNTVVVFGCGPVGQLAIASAKLQGAGRVFAVDRIQSRLAMARDQGAEVIDFEADQPVEALVELTGGIGVDRAIDAVGVDAVHRHNGAKQDAQFRKEVAEGVPKSNPTGENWRPGDGPSQALLWAVEALAKAGTLSIIGVYPESAKTFPIGTAMNKNLTLKMGNCPHRRYIPELLRHIRSGAVDVAPLLTQHEAMTSAIDAYKAFDRREAGWIKVRLDPAAQKPNGRDRDVQSSAQRPTP